MSHFILVLEITNLSVPELVYKSKNTLQRVLDNPTVFISPPTGDFSAAVTDLEQAALNASDGGKSFTAIKEDKRRAVIDKFTTFGHYILDTAKDDVSIIHLAGLDVKTTGVRTEKAFDVSQGEHSGMVDIKVISRPDTKYKWQYCTDPTANVWTDAGITGVRKTTISNLTPGANWFRVIFIDNNGEHLQEAVKFFVN